MTTDSVSTLGAEKFLSLTTFKRDGDAVAAPMWVAVRDGRLVFWTPREAYKVKRVRRDPRVTVVPCARMGAVAPDARPVTGTGTVVDDPAEVARVRDAIKAKYGVAFRIVTLIERLARRGRGEDRVVVAVTLDGATSA